MADANDEEADALEAGDTPQDPKEPKSSKAWLDMISDAEKAFRTYQDKCDSIDKLYANIEKLAATTRDRQMQIFWANISVIAPSIYSRPPVPVVIPRFKDQKELPRSTSELLERSAGVTFEKEDIDGVMHLVRDDLVVLARGAAWLRYEASSKDNNFTERVCIDHADRKDFLHEASRNWKECDWVAKRGWLTRTEMRKRFKKASGDVYKEASYAVRKDGTSDADDGKLKAGVWEIWSKSQNKVVWVSEGCEKCLDEDKPHLTLEGFFPCPRPAYGTVERRSLVPVPDMLFYKDQLEEINELTARIAALTEAVKVRGFYPAGAGEIGDAIEAALKASSNNQIMVPVSNWAMIGTGGVKDMIVWLPIDTITATITQLVVLRKQLIDDVYQITGLSDIMRGTTAATETLGAQQLKSQYGSIRIKDRQDELTRIARDITRIAAEIMAENFRSETLLDMSQMSFPTDDEIKKQAAPLRTQLDKITAELPDLVQKLHAMQQEIQTAQSDPEIQQMAQANPDQAKQIIGQVQQQMQQLMQQVQQMEQAEPQLKAQIQALDQTVTVEKVMKLLREQKLRPFILDIETDSTIAPDENASKQRATEFVTAVGGYMKEALPLLQTTPEAAPVVADTLKFVTSQYRAGRELEGTIDAFADAMKAKAKEPPAPNAEAQKAAADAQAAQQKAAADAAAAQAKQQHDAATLQLAAEKQQFEQQQAEAKAALDAQAARDKHELAQQQLRLDAQIATAKTAETSERHRIEQQKIVAAADEADARHELDWKKAELSAATSIQVALKQIESATIASELDRQAGIATQERQHAHEREMAAQKRPVAADVEKANAAMPEEAEVAR